MRVGVTGKTGSGKTTVSALVAMAAAARGLSTLAVDTDVIPNLGLSLGIDQAALDRARTVPRALVTGRGGGSVTTDQLLGGYGLATPAGVTLLHAMPSSEDPGGCCCPAHASGRSLLASTLDEADVAVVDMEAGLEHLERPGGTMAHTDVLVVVMEPSRKSSVTAARMVAMARSHGIDRIALVGNKGVTGAEGSDDTESFTGAAREMGLPLAGVVPASIAIADADRAGSGLSLGDGALRAGVEGILDTLR